MNKWIYYHNPNCSKSRDGKKLLEMNNIDFTIKEYLNVPLEISEIENLFNLLGLEPLQLIRTKETIFRELGLDKMVHDKKVLSRKEWAKIIVDNPILLERPILVGTNKAVLGRPPERLLEINN